MAARMEPTQEQVLTAVRSLYADEIRPLGRILLRRLREQAATAAAVDVEAIELIDPKFLRNVCESCSMLVVMPASGKEYSAELAGVRGVFVDPCSLQDPYPEALWQALAAHVAAPHRPTEGWPSGRYAAAQALAAERLPFLEGRSLGELCHIVQLAITERQLLGHSQGRLVPYGRSEACLKLQCAVRQQPLAGEEDADDVPTATWAELPRCLHMLLACSYKPVPGAVAVSNVKALFRAQLGRRLSETALGYARIGELLQDARLSQVCRVVATLQGQSLVCLCETLPLLCLQMPIVACGAAAAAAGRPRGGPSTCASQRSAAPQAVASLGLSFPPPAACLAVPATVSAASAASAVAALSPTAGVALLASSPAAAPQPAVPVAEAHLDDASAEELDKEDVRSEASSTCASSAADADLLSEGGDSESLTAAAVNFEDYGLVVKNGFLDEAPRRRHVRSRSA